MRLILDDAGGGLGVIARIRLVGELGKVRKELLDLPSDGARAMLARVKLTARALAIRLELTEGKVAPEPAKPVTTSVDAENLFEFDEDRKTSQRRKDNNAAMELLNKVNAGEISEDSLTEDDLATLAKYSGTGGGMTGADGKVGSQYEYYTPAPLAKGAWDLLVDLGFAGGKVLDPSAGTGIFGATAPASAVVDAIELDSTSGRINQLVNKSDNVTISAFESVAAATPDEIYDAVVTNIPFGDVASRGAERFKDTKYQNETLEGYFILRSLEKLRPGGLACFISSKGFMSNRGAKDSSLRVRASLMAEFMGAYRLPNKMFDATGADVVTDIIVFKKFARPSITKIEELQQQAPDVLREANVLWEPFLSGKYYTNNPKHVLGKVETGKGRFGEVERVINDDSISNISRMMRRFGGSRIDWDALELAPTEPIEYREGDAVTQAGVTLVMRNGAFVPVPPTEADYAFAEKLTASRTPMSAIEEGIDWKEAKQVVVDLTARSQYTDMPQWLFDSTKELSEHASKARQGPLFEALKVAIAVKEAMDLHAAEEPFNYAEAYPVLHAAIPNAVKSVGRVPAGLSTTLKDTLRILSGGIVYSSKGDAYTARWLGESISIETNVEGLGLTQKYERAKYLNAREDGFVPIDALREIMGDEFDINDDRWCVNSSGTGVMTADDYYTGNYAEFIKRNPLNLDAVNDEVIKAKLINQADAINDRLIRVDVSALSFNLSTPYVDMARKAEFLKKYVDPGFSLSNDDEKAEIIFTESASKIARNSEEMRNMKRFADYIKNGTLSTRTKKEEKEDDPEIERVRVERLQEIISRTNQQFEAWARSNPAIQEGLKARFNDPKNMYFRQVDDTSPLDIPGINPNLVPHGYQNACIRGYARKMSGIMGLDVGLGKTFTALLTVQHIQSIGVKKKTIFVVPNSTLSNWKKETETAFLDTSDCLFVGMAVGADGKAAVSSSNYAKDLSLVLTNRHRKIYMTYEAFSMIRLKDETKNGYEQYMRSADASFDASEESSKSKSIKKDGKLASAIQGAGKGSAAAPFLEDMGVDSIIIDEGHSFKNSKSTIDFKGAKFLASPTVSNRGLDAQIKCWYVRGLSPLGDGVIPLTATPITNSPLEIYSMLTLAVGEVELNNRMGGIRGADNFMEAFCDTAEETVTSLAGMESMSRVFRGLNNTDMLRDVLGQVATIRTAKEVGLKIPDIDEQQTPVQLSEPPIMAELNRLQAIYSAASLMAKDRAHELEPFMVAAVEAEIADTGEDIDLLAHPFNFINKVSKLIADPELHQQKTVFLISDTKLGKKVVDAFNAKNYREERQRPTPLQKEENIVRRTSKKQGEDTIELMVVKVEAFLHDDRIEIDTDDFKTQGEFIKIAEKMGLDLDATLPPKIAAMLVNFQKEQATPQAQGKAKQLIFCDMLGLHNKIKLVLQKRAGVPSSAISIINGVSVTDPADMQDIQDGFNAEGEDNRYLVVIANKKAEVGINLQKGTQAIHHLTVGYTPDSIHQRNGRGARQGNYVEKVRVYHYDANGTFDQYKRSIVSKKSDWIGEVMSGSGNKVKISGGMSREDVELLAQAAGSEEGMRNVQEQIANREEMERQKTAQQGVVSNLINMQAQQAVVARYPEFAPFFAEKVVDAAELHFNYKRVSRNLELANESGDEARISRAKAAEARVKREYDAAMKLINETVSIAEGSSEKTWADAFDSRSWLEMGRGYSSPAKGVDADAIKRHIEGALSGTSRYSNVSIELKEGAPLHEDWQVEVISAEKLAQESEQKAREMLEAANIDVSRIDAIKAGQAKIIRGAIVGAGDFVVDRKGDIWIVAENDAVFSYNENRPKMLSSNSVIMSGTIVTREMAGYVKVVEDAAAIDDARLASLESGALPEGAPAYYVYNTDVAKKMTVKPLVVARARRSYLADEDFQFILPAGTYTDPLLRHIHDEQAKLITTTVRDEFTYDPSKVNVIDGRLDSSDLPKALAKKALLNGMRVGVDSVRAFPVSTSMPSIIAKELVNFAALTYEWPSEADIVGVINSVDHRNNAMAALATLLRERFKSLNEAVIDNESAIDLLPKNLQDAYFDAYEAKFSRKEESDSEDSNQEPVSTPVKSGGDPEELVAIIGNTYEFKDTIKSTAQGVGVKAIFRGRRPSRRLAKAPENSWIVPRKVYDKLVADYTADVRRYDITIA